jgi:hypothetical protein
MEPRLISEDVYLEPYPKHKQFVIVNDTWNIKDDLVKKIVRCGFVISYKQSYYQVIESIRLELKYSFDPEKFLQELLDAKVAIQLTYIQMLILTVWPYGYPCVSLDALHNWMTLI